ncbi:MAG: YHS domain-containing (seleno)protein [Nitrospinaceae bacterium]
MKLVRSFVLMAALFLIPGLAFAGTTLHSMVAVQGYDVVTYQTDGKPQQGNGNHLTTYNGVTYIFVNEANKKRFESNPEKYAPVYGGYCAYGVAVGKKFVGDPEIWEVVDGKLYLNLDNKIKGIWVKDISGHIKSADKNWKKIKHKNPEDL